MHVLPQMAGVVCQDNELESMEAAQRFLLKHCKVCMSCIRVECDALHIVKPHCLLDCTAVRCVTWRMVCMPASVLCVMLKFGLHDLSYHPV